VNQSRIPPARLSASVLLLSTALISYQLLLIQILSIVQWYHFAYMIISVALLGFGAAGTFLSIFQKRMQNHFDSIYPFLLAVTSLLMAVSVGFSQTEFLYFDSYRLFSDMTEVWKIIAVYLIFFLPFFSGALAIGLVFMKNIEKIGFFYFANMTGSGIGGITAVVLMWFLFPEKLQALIAAIVLLASLISFSKEFRYGITLFIALTAAVILYVFVNPPALRFSEYKSLSRTLNLPQTKIISNTSSPYGMLHLVSSEYLRYAPGLSITYPDQVVVNNAAFNNGEWTGPLIRFNNKSVFRSSTEYLPYVIGKKNNVLVLNAGTGRHIKYALDEGAVSITAVEPDKELLGLLTKYYADMVDSVYNHPNVHIKNIYPRGYLLSAASKFDLIRLPVIDAFGGTSGLYALQEQYQLTREAFGEMFSMLTDNGVICISTWIDYPYKNPLKIIATIADALYEKGIENISSRTAAVKNWNTLTIIVKRNFFEQTEIDSIYSYCRRMKFDPVILPGIGKEERDFYNKLQDKSFYAYIDQLFESNEKREKFYSDYLFNIRPADDNKPYYSQFLKWKSISKLSDSFGNQLVPFFEAGYILLYTTFFQIIIIAFILIILPLFIIGWKGKNKPRTLFYFSGLGLGYMFIEIVLIQKFTLYFGNVIYSAAAVVSLMLTASGLGSLVSQKAEVLRSKLTWILFFITGSLILYSLILTPLLKITIVLSLPVKIVIASLLIGPAAFFMGMPFPLGLRMVSSKIESAGETAWAWGINGVFSVTGAVLATVIALELGFIWVMVFAAAAYMMALIANVRKH